MVDAVRAERGLQRSQLLQRRVADPLVRLDRGWQPLKLHLHRPDLALETTLVPGPLRLLVAPKCELIRLRPLDAPLLGDLFGGDPLSGELVLLQQLRLEGEARPLRDVDPQRHS